MKRGDSEKSKKGKLHLEFLERKVEVDRMTVRSMAAKTIEKISGNQSLLIVHREIPDGGFLLIEESTGALPEL